MYSRFPAGPGTQESHTPRTAQPLPVANSVNSCNTLRRTPGSRTTPRRTSARPASNCGFTSTRARQAGSAQARAAGSTRRQRDERHVGGDEGGPKRQRRAVERPRVRPVDGGHTRVGAKALVELVSPDVERDHGGRAVLEEAVGEPARRGSDVEASLAGDVRPEPGERRLELLPAARHEPRRRDQLDRRVTRRRGARLGRRSAVDVHAARHDERLGAASRLDEAARHEQRVKP